LFLRSSLATQRVPIDLSHLLCSETNPFLAETPSVMVVAEVTTTDLRKTRYQVESRDDNQKTRKGYEIETTDGEVVRLPEEEVEPISVVGE
jgi:hypothetical protein